MRSVHEYDEDDVDEGAPLLMQNSAQGRTTAAPSPAKGQKPSGSLPHTLLTPSRRIGVPPAPRAPVGDFSSVGDISSVVSEAFAPTAATRRGEEPIGRKPRVSESGRPAPLSPVGPLHPRGVGASDLAIASTSPDAPERNGAPGNRGAVGATIELAAPRAPPSPDVIIPMPNSASTGSASPGSVQGGPAPKGKGSDGVGSASYGRLLREGSAEWRRLLAGSLCLFGAAGCNLIVPSLFGNILDAMTTITDPTLAISMAQYNCSLLLVMTILGAFLSFGRSYLFSYAGEQMVSSIRKRLFRSMLVQELQFFDTCRTGELVSRLSADTVILKDAITSDVAMGARWVATILGSFVYLFLLSPKLALMVAALIPVSTVGTKLYGKYVKKLSKEARQALADATTVAEETVSNIKTVKCFVKEPHQYSRFSVEIASTVHLGMHAAVATGVFNGALAGFSTLVFTGIVYYGIHQVMDSAMSVGVLTSFLLYAMTINNALSSLAGLFSHFMKTIGATERVFDLLDRQPGMDPYGGMQLPTLEGKVEFKNVTFAYPARPDQPVLKGVSFTIMPGQVVALVGLSGAGKSTCVSLIERFYDPVEGQVLIDGVDARKLELSWLRSKIGLVNQEPVLFCTSIAENITFGVRAASHDDIIAAARLANAHSFISEFPEGYDTIVGERGARLSGGQQQRIAIARAVMKDPRILILDEATSSLDAHSEYLVKDALDRLMAGRTTLVIAHRLSTVINADVVMVMEHGQVVDAAPHKELMQRNALYASLVNRQLTAFDGNKDRAVLPVM